MVVRNYTDPKRHLSLGENEIPETMMVSKAGFGSSSFFQSSHFQVHVFWCESVKIGAPCSLLAWILSWLVKVNSR